MSFDFMEQTSVVSNLLNACLAALPYIPEPEKAVMIEALENFETFGVPIAWSEIDVDPEDTLGLSQDEKRHVIAEFIENYDCKESDWEDISRIAECFSKNKS